MGGEVELLLTAIIALALVLILGAIGALLVLQLRRAPEGAQKR